MLSRLIIEAAIKAGIITFAMITGFAYLTLLERRFLALLQVRIGPNRVGPQGMLQPAADGVKLFFKEDIVPDKADKIVFSLAPAITAIPAIIIMAVVPIGGTLHIPEVINGEFSLGSIHIVDLLNIDPLLIKIPFFSFDLASTDIALNVTNLNVGVLYILAVTSISVYGIVLAGWSSANKYSMMGGLRSSAQMISYELALGLSVIGPIMLAGSMSLNTIIDAQSSTWYVFLQPVAALVFLIAALAELNRAPFDLPEAEQELTAGYHTEYSGMKFGLFFMGEYMKMIALSAIAATLFFGGYRLFGIEEEFPILGPVILSAKILVLLLGMIWVRATLPRMRYDRLMAFGWKILLPLSLASVVVTAISIVI